MWRMTLGVALSLMILGCSKPAAEKPPAEKNSPAPDAKAASAVACTSPEQLVEAFKKAHTSKDIEAAVALTYWKGVDAQRRAIALFVFQNVFKTAIEKVSFEKCPPEKSWGFSWKGAEYTMNLKPIATLKVTELPDAQGGRCSMRFPVGVKDGCYYLAEAVRVQGQDHKTKQATKTTVGRPAIPADALGSIAGIAVDAEGKGVEDVAVSVYREEDAAAAIASATTEANGKFIVEKVAAEDDFVVQADKKGSILGVCGRKEHVAVQAGKTTDVGNIELKIPMSSKAKLKPAD